MLIITRKHICLYSRQSQCTVIRVLEKLVAEDIRVEISKSVYDI